MRPAASLPAGFSLHPANHYPPVKRPITTLPLLAFTALNSFATLAFAGPAAAPPPITPAPADNPLSFFDGKLVFDVQERLRWEIRENNYDFNDSIRSLTDDNWIENRFRFGMSLKPAPWLKFYVQGQDSREYLSDRADIPGVLGAEGDDPVDLRQGYVEIGNTSEMHWGVKIGRQVLAYGDERLVGPSEWNNISRTFDAVKLTYKTAQWSLDAFASTVVLPHREGYNQSDLFNGNETHRDQVFSGLYFSTTALGPQTTDLYVFHLHESFDLPGDTNFFTLGTRFKSKPGIFSHQPPPPHDGKSVADGKTPPPPPAPPRPIGFDYEGEFAFQTGDLKGRNLSAFAAHAGLGYTFDAAWLPRIGVEYNYASGDRDPLDGDVETFQNLFPSNHRFYGQMDAFSWQNIHDAALLFKVAPTKQLTTRAELHAFWLASTDDVWYRSNGATAVRPLTPAARAASNFAGFEADLTLSYAATKWLTLEAGYSHFWAGDYLNDTGAGDDADFGYLQATLNF